MGCHIKRQKSDVAKLNWFDILLRKVWSVAQAEAQIDMETFLAVASTIDISVA
jgi:hypothetical protein